MAIRAALTGHLVFSTIHTNDAATGFTRLLNWNVEPFLISSTVKGILAQRLVRRICPECKVEYQATNQEKLQLGLEPEDDLISYLGEGCLACRNTGYKGRIGIYELLLMSQTISELVLNNAPGYRIRDAGAVTPRQKKSMKPWERHKQFYGQYNLRKRIPEGIS